MLSANLLFLKSDHTIECTFLLTFWRISKYVAIFSLDLFHKTCIEIFPFWWIRRASFKKFDVKLYFILWWKTYVKQFSKNLLNYIFAILRNFDFLIQLSSRLEASKIWFDKFFENTLPLAKHSNENPRPDGRQSSSQLKYNYLHIKYTYSITNIGSSFELTFSWIRIHNFQGRKSITIN